MKFEDLEKLIKHGNLLDVNSIKKAKQPLIIAVGGGKGGVGKSFIAANLAAVLANSGFKVAVVDLDLGSPNLHTCLGMKVPKQTMEDFFSGDVENLGDLANRSSIKNLDFFAGSHQFWHSVKPFGMQKSKLINEFRKLKYDYIIFDLGAGAHVHTLDFFIFADLSVAVVTPEPTSIENVYVFMKGIFNRKIENALKIHEFQKNVKNDIMKQLSDVLPKEHTPYHEVKKWVENHGLKNKDILGYINSTNVGVILNQVRTNQDLELGESLSVVFNKYFGFTSKYIGAIRYDDSVWRSIRMCRPIGTDLAKSVIYGNLLSLSKEIVRTYDNLRRPIEEEI